ncbi:Ribosomal RNA small subunit methyltransferase B,16S rRNA methyltransferase B,tRNA and rRNA cytosine-C5-methylases,ribosomal RNA small subunit methyltransferase B,NOL1/NOP2/sun family [Chlamydia serpentis]|uniref:Ribosomal RNA small subunit methyltransferase B,16S rRNA methyltransferase B,tRNA and rRNA cytosine-C5-methylases,ribosomal RNA small subunit methyltransferase B,NOL1/NOP2/sun family n=1 Tax=Chlamydia serpentis TaxID=1967782 RepID=A0A2R8FBJ5_9CHLA|nr:RsmB/NOP family class I SAM-dependent RNA methyltransferase [Chlamydia serpentis]SPN73793.1 Ribosomal RNA small subunit methyltransferase B,16S rRNA methyltransferase B,tRNA and rRNA cytosine-C5-methylases,ribosomal RNA small subunit methyltransferase B,NOL1/NOP2/sun family [Chlamydia serpentis]
MVPFRQHHAYQLLKQLHTSAISEADRVSYYFKQNRSLGSKDRQWIQNIIFNILRHRRLLEALILNSGEQISPETLVSKVEEEVLQNLGSYTDLPWPVRYSISDDLADFLIQDYGEKQAELIAKTWLTEAPITIRVNTDKISLRELQEILEYPSCPGDIPESLHFAKRYPLQSTDAFRRGFFEIQDENSQRIAQDICLTEKDIVLDFCAGAGGKSLIFAQKAKHVVINDSRKSVLQNAKHRLLRAGARNFSLADELRLGSFSVVVVDAPCSGTGIYRRHPEHKWQFSKKLLLNYVRAQKNLLKQASSYVGPRGRLVYITCSLLKMENEAHVAHMHALGWKEVRRKVLPLEVGKGDGFYASHFQKI